MTVPLDHRDPGGATTPIAIYRRPATAEPRGTIVVAPGGPGEPGTAVIDRVTALDLPGWDVVTYDPRGVGASDPLDCLTPDDEELADDAPVDAIAAHYTGLVREHCSDDPLIRHVETTSVARDLEVLREALGQDRLDAVGFSYGTRVLATYAALFPEHTGRMVLDGAVEPSLQPASPEVLLAKAAAIEPRMRSFVQSCPEAEPSCAFTGTLEERMAGFASLVAALGAHPVTAEDGTPVTDRDARLAVYATLPDEDRWLALHAALKSAKDGDGTALLSLAEPESTVDDPNAGLAYWSVDCLDQKAAGPATMSEAELRVRLEAASPVQGASYLDQFAVCGRWPFEPTAPLPSVARAVGTPTLVVIGTTGDTAAPYPWAVAMAEKLPDATLVTVEGSGHTALGGSLCVDDIVVDYLDRGQVPAADARC